MKQVIINKIFAVVLVLFSIKATSQSMTVTLSANYSHEVKIYHDEPLLLIVSVTNQEAQENSRWNKAADRRLNELEELLKAGKIKREDYDREKTKLMAGKRQLSSVTIGAAGRPWSSLIKWSMVNINSGVEIPLAVKTMMHPSAEEVAVLNEKGYYTAYFGMDADKVKSKPAGLYEITASIENESSLPVRIEIKNETTPVAIAGSEEMLLRHGQYYWHAGDAAAGMKYAEKILQKNPASLDGLSLKGDLLLLNNSYAPALESYRKALKEYYKQNGVAAEPPEYLLNMIEFVKKELGQ